MSTMTLDYEPLAQAIKVVSASCDGAHALDGTGFSACDAVFGNSLAMLPTDAWDADIAAAAWDMLAHYRKQLSGGGIEFANIVRPFANDPLAGRDRAIRETAGARSNDKVGRESTFSVGGGLITLYSPYNKELVSDCREIAGRAWDNARKVNTFPVESVMGVRDLASKWGMTLPPAVADLPVMAMPVPEVHYGIEKVDGKILIRFAYDPAVVQSIHHMIPSAAFRQSDKVWTTVEENVGEAIEFAKAHGLTIQPGLSEDFDKMVESRKEMHEASLATEGTIHIDSAMELRPFQRAGVEYLLRARKAILGDEMGLGKSVQALATLVAENAFPAVIVCPATLKGVWVQEVQKFFPQLSVNVFSGTKPQPWFPADLTIVNYDIVYARVDDLIALNPKALVCDESHRIANGKAKHYCPNPECGMSGLRSNAVRCPQCKASFKSPAEKWTVKRTEGVIRISRSMDGDPIKLLLTGTPINNRPIELVSQLIAIDRIDEFGGRWRFQNRYAPGGTGATNLVELNKKLRQLCLPGDSQIITENGNKTIKELVETRSSLLVLGYLGGEWVWRPIVAHLKTDSAEMIRTWYDDNRYIDSTPDHPIWTDNRGYRKAREIVPGDRLRVVREPVCSKKQPKTSALLRSRLLGETPVGYERQGQGGSFLPVVQQAVRPGSCQNNVLQQELRKKLELGGEAGRIVHGRRTVRAMWGGLRQATENAYPVLWQTLLQHLAVRDRKARGVYPGWDCCGEAECGRGGGTIQGIQGETSPKRLARDNPPTGGVEDGAWVGAEQNGVDNLGRPDVLVGGLGRSSVQTGNRGRRAHPRERVATEDRQEEGIQDRVYRVDRVEVLQQGDRRWTRLGGSESTGKVAVYDVEVEDCHNFVADGVLVSNCFIRRKKADIYTELPPLVDAPVPLEIGGPEMARYAEIERDVVEFMANRAREIAEEAGEDGDAVYVEKKIRLEAVEHLVRINGLKTAISTLKYDAVVKWIEDFLADSDEKLIVMGEHIAMIEKLSEHFGPKVSVKIRGGVSQKARMDAVDRFQNDPETRLFIGSSIAASEGLTLTAASNIAMIEHPWTPSIVAQCAARCWGRVSDLHGATMWHLVVPQTIDIEILALLEAKKVVVDAATDGVELDGKQGSVLGDLLWSLAVRGGFSE